MSTRDGTQLETALCGSNILQRLKLHKTYDQYVYMYVRMRACTYVCMYVLCMYVCVYVRTHVRIQSQFGSSVRQRTRVLSANVTAHQMKPEKYGKFGNGEEAVVVYFSIPCNSSPVRTDEKLHCCIYFIHRCPCRRVDTKNNRAPVSPGLLSLPMNETCASGTENTSKCCRFIFM